jgi:hypothetical protein
MDQNGRALLQASTECEGFSDQLVQRIRVFGYNGIEVYLVNARQAKNVSGRKSDMLDCQWLRILHSYGLLPASFRPSKDIGVLRAYMRHRQMLIEWLFASHCTFWLVARSALSAAAIRF